MRAVRLPIACAALALCACNAIAGIREPKEFAGKWTATGTETITNCSNGNTVDGPTSYEFEFVREGDALVGINRDFSSADGSDVCRVRLGISGTKASLRGDAAPSCTFRLEGGVTGRTTYTSVDFDLGDETGKGTLTIRGSLVFSNGVSCASYTGTFTMAQTAEAN